MSRRTTVELIRLLNQQLSCACVVQAVLCVCSAGSHEKRARAAVHASITSPGRTAASPTSQRPKGRKNCASSKKWDVKCRWCRSFLRCLGLGLRWRALRGLRAFVHFPRLAFLRHGGLPGLSVGHDSRQAVSLRQAQTKGPVQCPYEHSLFNRAPRHARSSLSRLDPPSDECCKLSRAQNPARGRSPEAEARWPAATIKAWLWTTWRPRGGAVLPRR